MPASLIFPPWSAVGLSAALGALSFAVLGPALLRARARDVRVAAGWMLGSSLAVGHGGFGLWLLWASTCTWPEASALSPDWAGAAWCVSTAGTAIVLVTGRAIDTPWPRHAAQALLLAGTWLLCRACLEWGLGGHPDPVQLAGQFALTAGTLAAAIAWLTHTIHTPGRWYWRQGITPLLPGAGLGLAVALTPPAAPMTPNAEGLPLAALTWAMAEVRSSTIRPWWKISPRQSIPRLSSLSRRGPSRFGTPRQTLALPAYFCVLASHVRAIYKHT